MKKTITVFYFVLLCVLTIYSFSLMDPNITFINHPLWQVFREPLVYLGYYRRDISFGIYLFLLIGLFLCHRIFVKQYKNIPIVRLVFWISLFLLISYPFLSHDFFNYMFDARIATFYHKNPYAFRALDFPQDQWTRFMHWTHRTYPYGPIFLLITFIPSFLGMGKFLVTFLLVKLTFILFYVFAVIALNKINRKWAVMFATHPLVIIEGLVCSHNDLIGVSLALLGICWLWKKQTIKARFVLLLSFGIKYITWPIVALKERDNKLWNGIVAILTILTVLYLSFFQEIQPWYFLTLFIFLPYFSNQIQKLELFFFGLLLSYYPYIYLGGWDSDDKIAVKHLIIFVFFIIAGVLAGASFVNHKLRKSNII